MINPRSILPQCKAQYYRYDKKAGYYIKTEIQPDLGPIMRLPHHLKVEAAQVQEIKCNAPDIIRSRERYSNADGSKGRYKFFTGMLPTDFNNWHYGNDYQYIAGVKTLSLCLFHFNDLGRLTVFYYAGYYPEGRQDRERMIRLLIPQLMRKYIL